MADEEYGIETIMRLAQQLQGERPPPVDTRAPDNELGLLGRMFGGGGTSAGLSTAQQEMQARRALMAFGTGVTEAATRYQPYGERSFMGAIGEGNRAAWGTTAQYEQEMRQAAKEAREEQRQGFQDRISSLDAAGKVAKMQQELKLLALRGKGLDVGQGDTDTASRPPGGGGGGGTGYGHLLTGDIEHDEPIIRQRESGGKADALNYVARADPSMRAKGATASGLYGFVDSTWKEGLQMVGGDAKAYPTAQSAPPELQKQVFQAVYKARGTTPWDSRKWGQDWQKGADGKYTLVTTPAGSETPPRGGVAARTGGTDVAGPPGTVPVKPATAPPPGVATPLPQPEALEKAKATGQSVPILNGQGVMAHPDGMVGPPRTRGGGFGGPPGAAPPPPAAPPPAEGGPSPPDAQVATQPPGAPPPSGVQPPAAPQAKEPDDTVGLPPGVPGYRAFRQANLRQPTPEERRTFGGELTPEDRRSVAEERQQLERALKNANTAYQQGTGESSAVSAAQKNLADHIERVRKAGAEADSKGKEREAKFWENQETQLRAAHQKLIEGGETRLTADNAEKNKRIAKINEGVDADVATTSERIGSLEALRVLSSQLGKSTLLGDVRVGNRTLADIISSTGWGGPELAKKAADVQTFQSAVNAAIKDIKSGVAMGAVSDRDMIFLENMVANPKQDERTRNLIITGLIQAQERKREVAVRIGNILADGKTPPHQAILQAHQEVKPIFRSVPEGIAGWTEQKRAKWFADNIRPGQLYRREDDTVDVYPGPQGHQ